MKLKTLFMSALAASTVLVSCDKSEMDDAPVADKQMKSVSISLANVKAALETKGVQAAQKAEEVTLNKFAIFFVDAAGNFYEGYDATLDANGKVGNALDRVFADASNVNSLPTYHYIDAAVNKVIVVGNYRGTEANMEALTKESDLRALTVNIGDQQSNNDLVLFGEAELVRADAEKEQVADHTNAYKANVEICPLVSRIEVAAFRYNAVQQTDDTEANRNYSSITLNTLAFNTYYESCTYGNVQTELATPHSLGVISGQLKNDPITEQSALNWLNDRLGENKWFADAIPSQEGETVNFPAVTLSQTNEFESDVDVVTGKVLAYNFFVGKDMSTPQLVLGMLGEKDGKNEALYLATKNLLDGNTKNAVVFEPGKVYRMDIIKDGENYSQNNPFEFDDDDFKSSTKCVDITVKKHEWVVTYISPSF